MQDDLTELCSTPIAQPDDQKGIRTGGADVNLPQSNRRVNASCASTIAASITTLETELTGFLRFKRPVASPGVEKDAVGRESGAQRRNRFVFYAIEFAYFLARQLSSVPINLPID